MYEKATSNTQTCFREVVILTLPTTPFQCRLLPQKGGSSCPPRLRPVGRDMKIGSMLGSSASRRPSCETRDRYAAFQKIEVIFLGLPRIKTIAFGVYIMVPYLRKLPYVVLDPCKEKPTLIQTPLLEAFARSYSLAMVSLTGSLGPSVDVEIDAVSMLEATFKWAYDY